MGLVVPPAQLDSVTCWVTTWLATGMHTEARLPVVLVEDSEAWKAPLSLKLHCWV